MNTIGRPAAKSSISDPRSWSTAPTNPGKALAVVVADAIRRHRAGDRTAMPDLAREVRPWLYRIAVVHRLNHHSAEDVVQETLLAIMLHVHELRDPEAGLGWLSVIARHEAVQMIRKDRRVDLPGELPDPAETAAPDDPEKRAIDLMTGARLADAVARLPERCGNILRLAFLADERDYATISTTLGIPVGSIGPTRQRALRKMREMLVSDESWEYSTSA
jgi:RNA polymerase sigma factor (sigma-70 family)